METGQPSRTAWSAARYRAAHQLIERGAIFPDPFAVRILGVPPDELVADAPRRAMRVFIAARHRFAEDALAAAVSRGVRQVVVLGAGLDTFAYRNAFDGVRVIEVDHPDTQAWKRERLAATGIEIPPSVSYAGVDFETATLASSLKLDGPAFFLWLGVVPYLTPEGFTATISYISELAGSEVVFDYAQPPSTMPPARRVALEERAARVARIGEPWLTYFEPEEIAARLRELGFREIEDLGPAQLAARFFDRHDVPPGTPGGHLLRAVR
ncbi:class I SAM-dependent methyltransferase [Paractinoplanes rhizophilus]|jgi:methyltransferase (TIGR00027 family)|uniref:S-adenosyl-L-methionine-dependent methyltransferase n=1 Tax=Paractinoplanes rhizophilus TaxID=1416877 RepID=A0ABW2HPW6_9ACTN